jgi:hypothetical protein
MKTGTIHISDNKVSINPINGAVWLSAHEIAGLFDVFVSKVTCNIRSILKSGIFRENNVCRYHHCSNGAMVELYSLEIIIALSFRIHSHQAELFRNWLLRRATAADTINMAWKIPMFNTLLN